jgi:hypothetical protein
MPGFHAYEWYCGHGYFEGNECPDCDTSAILPSYFDAIAENEEILTAQTRDLLNEICASVAVAAMDFGDELNADSGEDF